METEPVKNELAVVKPAEMMRLASDVAGVCAEIVQKTAVNIKGKRYVKVEGWEAIATAHGCVAGSRDVERVEGGFRAIGEIRRIDNGTLISQAEGFCGDDEPEWVKKPEYARRGLAQTRAISRAGRSAFAHVVVLIDQDLSTTPAEEVPMQGFDNGKPSAYRQVREVMKAPEPKRFSNWRDCIMHFSKHAGKQLGELSNQQLSWYYEEWMPKKKADKQYPLTVKDQNLFDALENWRMEMDKKRLEFEARTSSVATDEIPMDYPEQPS